MRIAHVNAVVVGAGIGGRAAALLPARADASVSLPKRIATPSVVGAGILLQPNGLAVLTGLGLADALERTGHRISVSAVHGAGRSPIATLAVPDFGAGFDHVLAVRRSLLYEVLLAAVSDVPAIDWRLGATVHEVGTDGSVDLEWLGRPSTIDAEFVVGADGIGSTVRAGGTFGVRQRTDGRIADRYLRGLAGRRDGDIEGEHWTARSGTRGSGTAPATNPTARLHRAAARETIRSGRARSSRRLRGRRRSARARR